MNHCLSTLIGSPIYVVGCGRTDSGVHAMKFILHFDTETEFDLERTLFKLNRMLPMDIAIRTIYPVSKEMHARFSARSRTYRYYITIEKNPLELGFVTLIFQDLNIERMKEAARIIPEYNDFEALSKASDDQKHHLVNIEEVRFIKKGSHLIFHIRANRFLRGMIRIIMGTLIQVGKGKMTVEEFRSVIESKDRKRAGAAAQAQGLYLWDISYPADL